jgi:hypothetical protein
MSNEIENLNLRPKVTLTIQIKDKNGNVIREFTKEEDPLTRWALRSMFSFITYSNTTVKAEDGTTKTFRGDLASKRWSYKIAIGLDSTSPTFEDYKLGAKERETTSITVTALIESDSSGQFDIKYDFLIETDKTFYEFGLFGYAWDGSTYYPFLVSRDVVSGGVPVPANSYLTVIYRVILGSV